MIILISFKGNPEKLRKAGVKPIVDLPGVGLNFQDHYLTFSVFRAKPDVESFDDFVRGDPATQKAVFDQWNINGTIYSLLSHLHSVNDVVQALVRLPPMALMPVSRCVQPRMSSSKWTAGLALSSVLAGNLISRTSLINL